MQRRRRRALRPCSPRAQSRHAPHSQAPIPLEISWCPLLSIILFLVTRRGFFTLLKPNSGHFVKFQLTAKAARAIGSRASRRLFARSSFLELQAAVVLANCLAWASAARLPSHRCMGSSLESSAARIERCALVLMALDASKPRSFCLS